MKIVYLVIELLCMSFFKVSTEHTDTAERLGT